MQLDLIETLLSDESKHTLYKYLCSIIDSEILNTWMLNLYKFNSDKLFKSLNSKEMYEVIIGCNNSCDRFYTIKLHAWNDTIMYPYERIDIHDCNCLEDFEDECPVITQIVDDFTAVKDTSMCDLNSI